jgi:hypothetical protein
MLSASRVGQTEYTDEVRKRQERKMVLFARARVSGALLADALLAEIGRR